MFAPGGAVDGSLGPAPPPQDFSNIPNPPMSPPPSLPEPPPIPPQPKYQGGIFGGLGFVPQGWNDGLQPTPQTPEPRPVGYRESQEAWPGVRQSKQDTTTFNVDRTPRNGMSLDESALARPAPAGQPIDIRSQAQRGGPDPRIERARAFGNFIASLGKGLTAVGNLKPGTFGASAFAAGAGGSLTGHTENENHYLDRDERGLDRGERARERNQTFDYQNRTLQANTKYHDDMVEQHRLDRDQKSNAERYFPVGQTAEGKIIYQDRNHPGKEIQGENSVVSRTGAAGQGGNTERLARIIQAEHGKDADGNYKITMEDAVHRAQKAPTDSADILRRERMARQDLKDHEAILDRNKPKKTLEDFRRALGLPPAPTPPVPGELPLGSRSGLVDPDRMRREGPKFNWRTEGQITPPPALAPAPPRPPAPIPAPPVAPPPNPASPQATPAVPPVYDKRNAPLELRYPAGRTPPQPPHVPAGSGYSAETGKWYVRGPDGKSMEVPAP